jgi:hypothetical protein
MAAPAAVTGILHMPAPASPPPRPEDGPVPVFGTWPRIYAAVLACALAVMALLALFSRWPY